ncbi:MAG: hypothetical protein KTR27_11960 [Leptolyngbyaceae cyanobacterium MAG.088]|nr:hypothetical protein [Leptolyngbyaceae cyanobacterium MAG.088]
MDAPRSSSPLFNHELFDYDNDDRIMASGYPGHPQGDAPTDNPVRRGSQDVGELADRLWNSVEA